MQNGIASLLALPMTPRLTSRDQALAETLIDDPHRRWRLPARDQYFRADQGDLWRLRAWRRLAVDGAWRGCAQDHAQHQCRAVRLRRSGRDQSLGTGPDDFMRREPVGACDRGCL